MGLEDIWQQQQIRVFLLIFSKQMIPQITEHKTVEHKIQFIFNNIQITEIRETPLFRNVFIPA